MAVARERAGVLRGCCGGAERVGRAVVSIAWHLVLPGTGVLAVLGRGAVDPSTPVVLADDAGVTRGDGCFEGIRVMPVGAGEVVADNLERHLARFARSAAALEIPF